MPPSALRLAYRKALSKRNDAEAARLVRENPSTFGTPPPGVSDAIAAVASDPMEPGWMVVEWSVQENNCEGVAGCRPYTLRANQFDHAPTSLNPAQARAWFNKYVQNRKDHAPLKDQLGTTLYLLKVDKVEPIVDFDGVVIDD